MLLSHADKLVLDGLFNEVSKNPKRFKGVVDLNSNGFVLVRNNIGFVIKAKVGDSVPQANCEQIYVKVLGEVFCPEKRNRPILGQQKPEKYYPDPNDENGKVSSVSFFHTLIINEEPEGASCLEQVQEIKKLYLEWADDGPWWDSVRQEIDLIKEDIKQAQQSHMKALYVEQYNEARAKLLSQARETFAA